MNYINAFSQTATASAVFKGFQACGGCTVCGADYWCTNTPGSYCGNTARCKNSSFLDPVPPGNIVTSVTINFFTASCVGSSIESYINGESVPFSYDGNWLLVQRVTLYRNNESYRRFYLWIAWLYLWWE